MTSRGICQSVGVSSRKGDILDKNGAHKKKPGVFIISLFYIAAEEEADIYSV